MFSFIVFIEHCFDPIDCFLIILFISLSFPEGELPQAFSVQSVMDRALSKRFQNVSMRCKLDRLLCSEFYVRWSHRSVVAQYCGVVIMKILRIKGICGVIIVAENVHAVLLK